MYGFAYNNAGSEELWDIFIKIIKESAPDLDERNIVMILYSL